MLEDFMDEKVLRKWRVGEPIDGTDPVIGGLTYVAHLAIVNDLNIRLRQLEDEVAHLKVVSASLRAVQSETEEASG